MLTRQAFSAIKRGSSASQVAADALTRGSLPPLLVQEATGVQGMGPPRLVRALVRLLDLADLSTSVTRGLLSGLHYWLNKTKRLLNPGE